MHEIKRFEQKHKQEHLFRTDQGLGRIAGTWIQTGAHSITGCPMKKPEAWPERGLLVPCAAAATRGIAKGGVPPEYNGPLPGFA